MKFAVLQFPGSNCDQDVFHVLHRVLGQPTEMVWHKESSLQGADCVVVPGGFSYGDYLRCGAIARFSPVMRAVAAHAAAGGLVLGICNGFQILCEAGLLPGALIRNRDLHFICRHVYLRVETSETPFTSSCRQGQVLHVPIAHGEGNYVADEATLNALEASAQIVFRYCNNHGAVTPATNPNGSCRNIAGICNTKRNVLGMMPHPERAAEPELDSTDGRAILESALFHLAEVR
jgi:phosphoribosylformylglycinamidine synthase